MKHLKQVLLYGALLVGIAFAVAPLTRGNEPPPCSEGAPCTNQYDCYFQGVPGDPCHCYTGTCSQ